MEKGALSEGHFPTICGLAHGFQQETPNIMCTFLLTEKRIIWYKHVTRVSARASIFGFWLSHALRDWLLYVVCKAACPF
jgi:hypothetical protein